MTGVIESSQGPSVGDCPRRQLFCPRLGGLPGQGCPRVVSEGTAGWAEMVLMRLVECPPRPLRTQGRNEPESDRSPTLSTSCLPQHPTPTPPTLFSSQAPPQIPHLRLGWWKGVGRHGDPSSPPVRDPQIPPPPGLSSSGTSSPCPTPLHLCFLSPKQIHRADRVGQETFI